MELTHFGHACLLVETSTARLLFDPGTLAAGFEHARDLDGILITHQHADHLDLPRLRALLAANPGSRLFADPGSELGLRAAGIEPVVVRPGERLLVAGAAIDVSGGQHAVVHADIPTVPNGAFVIDDGAFFHPGDSFFVPPQDIDILGAPVSGPWLKVGEAIDFVRAVAPRVAVPVHEAALANTATHYGMLTRLAPPGTAFTPLERGAATRL